MPSIWMKFLAFLLFWSWLCFAFTLGLFSILERFMMMKGFESMIMVEGSQKNMDYDTSAVY